MGITNELYSKLPNLVLGFHGCDETTFHKVMHESEQLKPSKNSYDWLGNGVYFWENNYERAREWAESKYGKAGRIIGAVIDLGYCLNLTDYISSEILGYGYKVLKASIDAIGEKMPTNKNGRSKTDVLLRDLDCAVIEQVHQLNRINKMAEYDSVRGVFTEGKEMFPGSALQEKTHIQICVRNPNCIKGYFVPIQSNDKYKIP